MLLALRSLWEGGADVVVDGSGLGVATSPAIGTAFRIDVGCTTSGIAASPAIGLPQIDVTFAIAGVGASPAIGEGIVDGAASAPAVVSQGGAGFGRPELAWFKRQQARKKRPFDVDGVAANPQVGRIQVDIEIPVSGVAANLKVGEIQVDTVLDLSAEEMMVLNLVDEILVADLLRSAA